MKLRTISTFFFLFTTLFFLPEVGFAQIRQNVSGTVTDSTGSTLGSATVSLVNLRDSTLYSFYLTDDDGLFLFKNVPAGIYRVHVSRLGFQPAFKNIETGKKEGVLELGNIAMKGGELMMEDVRIVEEAPPVTLRGDTLEFNAASFRTAPNASVEDLLKKLPGVEVESDGTLKINGQQVNKIYVDGKEFFGSDPTMATRNLPAEAIKKVQVFDQKTETEKATGMDDGETDVTINLKLKEEYKKGKFGYLTGGGGTTKRWMGKASVNAFTDKNQFSLIANGNNINEAGFSFMDLLRFTGGMGDMIAGNMGGGGTGGNSAQTPDASFPVSWLTSSQTEGINTQGNIGLRWSRDFGDKLKVTSNYTTMYLSPLRNSLQAREYFLPDSSYTSNQNKHDTGWNLNHRLEADIIWQINEKTKFRIRPVASLYQVSANTTSTLQNISEDALSLSQVSNLQNNRSLTGNFSGTASFTKGFRRKGRSFAVDWTGNYRPSSTQLDLSNQLSFITPDTSFAAPQTLQRWNTAESSNQHTVNLSYTQPFFFRWLAEATLSGSLNAASNEREVFSQDTVTGQYDIPLPGLSNLYNSEFLSGTAGLKAKRGGKKLSFSLGMQWQQASLHGNIPTTGFEVRQQYGRLLPNASADIVWSQFRRLNLNYSSRMRAPSVTQLQPLINNTNPLFQQLGNPDLDPQTDHSLRVQLNLLNPNKGRFIMLSGNGTYSFASIINSQQINSLGVTTTLPVNRNGVWNSNAQFTWSESFKKIKSRFRFSPRATYAHNLSLVNGTENPSGNLTLRPAVRWSFDPTDSFSISAGANWSWTRNSFASGNGTDFYRTNISADLNWIIWKGIRLNGEFNYSIVQSPQNTTRYPLLKASIAKTFLKGQRAEIKLSVFDMLKRNTGITQNVAATYSELLTYNTLSRYYMLTFTWRLVPFSQGGGGRDAMFRMMERSMD